MQRRMSSRVLGVFFLAALVTACLLPGGSVAADKEVVIAVWTSPEAENLKRAALLPGSDRPPRVTVPREMPLRSLTACYP